VQLFPLPVQSFLMEIFFSSEVLPADFGSFSAIRLL